MSEQGITSRPSCIRAERRAAPKPAREAMCMPVDPACIAAPSGGRPAYSLAGGLT